MKKLLLSAILLMGVESVQGSENTVFVGTHKNPKKYTITSKIKDNNTFLFFTNLFLKKVEKLVNMDRREFEIIVAGKFLNFEEETFVGTTIMRIIFNDKFLNPVSSSSESSEDSQYNKNKNYSSSSSS